MSTSVKYIFSGHESFQCRQLWLKKGYDFVNKARSFNSSDAVFHLGVGKNMVLSIKFWLKAFNILDDNDELTSFADLIFGDEGFDEYLEDEATLWLLHYHLIKNRFATTYSLIFNELRREKVEFTKENFVSLVKRRAEGDLFLSFNEKTLGEDFDVFRKMYLSSNQDGKSIEDSFAGLLTDLNLIKSYGTGKDDVFFIENSERENIPFEVFLYSILENENYGLSINLNSLENDYNGPGAIFALNKAGLTSKISEAVDSYRFITYTDHAGIKELQFKKKEDPIKILRDYYHKAKRHAK
jgi:hypothetical protein